MVVVRYQRKNGSQQTRKAPNTTPSVTNALCSLCQVAERIARLSSMPSDEVVLFLLMHLESEEIVDFLVTAVGRGNEALFEFTSLSFAEEFSLSAFNEEFMALTVLVLIN